MEKRGINLNILGDNNKRNILLINPPSGFLIDQRVFNFLKTYEYTKIYITKGLAKNVDLSDSRVK